MIWFLIIAGLIAAVSFLLLYPKLNIIIEYRGGKLKVFFKSILFRYTLDDEKLKSFSGKSKGGGKNEKSASRELEEDKEKTAEGFFAKLEKAKTQFFEVREIVETVFQSSGHRVEFSNIYIRSKFGTGDAAHTGMAYGAVWTIIGNVYAFLCRFFKIEFPEVELIPAFNETIFEIEAEGIIKMRLVHIISAALMGFRAYKKHRKEKGAI